MEQSENVPAAAPNAIAPARRPASLPAVSRAATAPVRLPRAIELQVPLKLRPAMQILTAHPPIIAGQSVAQYFQLLEIAVVEWLPQTFQQCALVKQQVDAECEIIGMQQVQTALLNSAIGAEFLQILNASEEGAHASEHHAQALRSRAMKNVVFAALGGHAEAVEYLEGYTGRNIGIGPDTPAHLAPAIPLHVFADRAITTRIGRRDAAYRELSRLKDEHAARMADKFISVADYRRHLPLSDYIRLLIEADLMKQAEPVLYGEQLLEALEEKKRASAAEAGAPDPVTPPSSPGEDILQKLKRANVKPAACAAAAADADTSVSVHAPSRPDAPRSPKEPANDVPVAD